jgi:hypothetical protein
VKSVYRIDKLFAGTRSRGMIAAQPVEVLGIEFVPEGRTESVLAVDLIDAGSIAGLKVNAPVGVEYEGSAPRTAQVRSATRGFLSRNLRGIVVDSALYLGVLVGGLICAQFIGRAWTRLVARR